MASTGNNWCLQVPPTRTRDIRASVAVLPTHPRVTVFIVVLGQPLPAAADTTASAAAAAGACWTASWQRLDLQRGWAEEKGAMRRSAEDALRRASEGKARAEEKAGLEVMIAAYPTGCQTKVWSARTCIADRFLRVSLVVGLLSTWSAAEKYQKCRCALCEWRRLLLSTHVVEARTH